MTSRLSKSVRDRLAEDSQSEETYALMKQALEDCLQADRGTTVKKVLRCKHCQKETSYSLELRVPDSKARLDAIALWLNQGLGTPKATVEVQRGLTFDDIVQLPAEVKDQLRARLVEIAGVRN